MARVRFPSYREWRKNRDRAGILLGLVARTPRGRLRRKAWRVYKQWANAEITYKEARERLRRLVEKAGRG